MEKTPTANSPLGSLALISELDKVMLIGGPERHRLKKFVELERTDLNRLYRCPHCKEWVKERQGHDVHCLASKVESALKPQIEAAVADVVREAWKGFEEFVHSPAVHWEVQLKAQRIIRRLPMPLMSLVSEYFRSRSWSPLLKHAPRGFHPEIKPPKASVSSGRPFEKGTRDSFRWC